MNITKLENGTIIYTGSAFDIMDYVAQALNIRHNALVLHKPTNLTHFSLFCIILHLDICILVTNLLK